MHWKLILSIVCAYGFLKEFRPSEPYLYQYQTQFLNLTDVELESQVYPVWTYSYLTALIPVFLLTDLLRYKPVLLLESISYMSAWIFLIWGGSVFSQQMVEVSYGWATATEIGYYSYIYAAVDKNLYQLATSYTRAAVQGGKCISYALSQVLVTTKVANYSTLNYISLSSVSIIFFFALALPCISWKSAKKHSKKITTISGSNSVEGDKSLNESNEESSAILPPKTYLKFVKGRLRSMGSDFVAIYKSAFVCKWSLWWAMATCGNLQIGNYVQTLWGVVQTGENDSSVYNGVVEAANTALSTTTILLLQKLTVNWKKWGEICLVVISLTDAALLIIMGQAKSIWLMYACYIGFRVLYQTTITIAQFNLAKKLKTESFGLVFGFNTFVALAIETVLTLVVADQSGLHLDIRSQFTVYSGYHAVIGSIFLITYGAGKICKQSQR